MSSRSLNYKDPYLIGGIAVWVFINLTAVFVAGKTIEKVGWAKKGRGFKAALAGSVASFFALPLLAICAGIVLSLFALIFGALSWVLRGVQKLLNRNSKPSPSL